MPGMIESLWLSYERAVVPRDAGPAQRREARLAFYAGAGSIFTKILESLTPGPDAEPADIGMLDGIMTELEAFADERLKEAVQNSAPSGNA